MIWFLLLLHTPHPRRVCFMDNLSEGTVLLKRVRRRGPLGGRGAYGKEKDGLLFLLLFHTPSPPRRVCFLTDSLSVQGDALLKKLRSKASLQTLFSLRKLTSL